jgi:hypothetical protein
MVSHISCQLGYIINTQLMTVTIPGNKCEAMLKLLCTKWGPHHHTPLPYWKQPGYWECLFHCVKFALGECSFSSTSTKPSTKCSIRMLSTCYLHQSSERASSNAMKLQVTQQKPHVFISSAQRLQKPFGIARLEVGTLPTCTRNLTSSAKFSATQ